MISLLPHKSTLMEKIIERVYVNHTQSLDVSKDLERELSLDKCSERILPYHAYNYGVPFWSDEWEEIYKRQLIKKFMHIHRIRGTLGAMEEVLQAFRVNVRVKEWFEDHKFNSVERAESDSILNKEYFFEVNLYLNENNWGVGERAVRQIRAIINWVKPILSEYKLKILFAIENQNEISSAVSICKICRMEWNYEH